MIVHLGLRAALIVYIVLGGSALGEEGSGSCASGDVPQKSVIVPELEPSSGIGFVVQSWLGDAPPSLKVLEKQVQEAWGGLPFGSYAGGSVKRSGTGHASDVSAGAPASKPVQFHSEMSYSFRPPLYVAFVCLDPAEIGGLTKIASTRNVTALLPPTLVEKMGRLGLRYVRRLGHGAFLKEVDSAKTSPAWYQTWQDFSDKEEFSAAQAALETQGYRVKRIPHPNYTHSTVEAGAPMGWDHAMLVEWIMPPFASHPRLPIFHGQQPGDTGKHLFMSMLDFWQMPYDAGYEQRRAGNLSEDNWLPLHVLWGDGTEITVEEHAAISVAYDRATVHLALQKGDVVIMDNYKWAHGRTSYSNAPNGGSKRSVMALLSENIPRTQA